MTTRLAFVVLSLGVASVASAHEPGLQSSINNQHQRFGYSPDATRDVAPHLQYDSGPVISHIDIITVFWGPHVQNQNELNNFYYDTTKGPYVAWLDEYNTPSQAIGRGKRSGSVVIINPPAGPVIDDSVIQNTLAQLIHNKELPPTDGDLLFMVHFPPGVTITDRGETSCVDFCAYHGTFGLDGYMTYYGVVADQGGACSSGCGGAMGNVLDDTTVVASHEMVESITDAGVGLSTGITGWPLAWYDPNYGEAGDICNAMPAKVGKWYVQRIWSNKYGSCIAEAPTQGSTPAASPPPFVAAPPRPVTLP